MLLKTTASIGQLQFTITLDKAIIDIGEKEFSTGLTYVALSRVRSIKDML